MTPRLALLPFSLVASAALFGPARAQAFGEQAPLQFKYNNQGATDEIYRMQLSGAAASASASASVGGGGLGAAQSTNQLDNSVQINNSYYVTGAGTLLNVSGDQVSATQSSAGTTQTNSNLHSSGVINQTASKTTSSSAYLNK